MEKVRISDIAKKLNISRNTVSKVFNNRGCVSDQTRDEVIQTAIELGYENIPHDWVAKKRAKNILVIATAPDYSQYWGEIINGIIEKMEKQDYNCFYHFLSPQQMKGFTLPEMLIGNNISGIIVMNVYEPKAIELINQLSIPTVYFDIPLVCDDWEINGDIILVEGRRSVMKVTRKFIDQGLSKIGFIGDITYCKSIFERWCGFTQAMDIAGLEINKDYCLTQSSGGRFYCHNEVGFQIDELFRKGIGVPEAFVCANDAIAYGLMDELKQKGYAVSEDVKVSGFDGTVDNDHQYKLFSTVKVETKYIGIRLAEQMIWRIQNHNRQYEIIKINGDLTWNQ